MPFAFCQFTVSRDGTPDLTSAYYLLTRLQCDADAENAGEHGNGAVILGRPCRVEKATANCNYITPLRSYQDGELTTILHSTLCRLQALWS